MSLASPRAWTGLVLAGLLLVLLPGRAAAERRVALLEIEGARSPRLQQSIAALIKSKHEVLRASTYRDAAKRIRAPRMTPKDIKKTCAYLEIDGVLEGTLSPEAGRYRLTLRLRSGKTGAVEWKQGMWLNAPRLSDKMAKGLKGRLLAAIGALPGGDEADEPAEDEAEAPVAADEPEESLDGEEAAAEPKAKPPKKLTKAEKARLAKEEKAAAAKAAKEAKAEKERLAREEKAEKERLAREKAEAERIAKADKAAKDKAAKDKAAKDKAAADKAAKERAAREAAEDEGDGELDDEEPAGLRAGKDKDKDKGKKPARDDEGDAEADGEEGDEVASDDEDPTADDGEDDADADADADEEADGPVAARTAANAAATVVAGMSFTARRLGFTYAPDLEDIPPGYNGALVPGIHLAAEVYPLAFGGKRQGALPRLGVGLLFDRVIKLQSTVEDGQGGTAALPTTQSKYSIDVRYRQPLGALTVTGLLAYSNLAFKIDKGAAPDGVIVDIPNVKYGSVDPGVALRYSLSGSLALLASAKMMLLLGSGEIGQAEAYGVATVLGFDADVGAEYAVTDRILVRAMGHFQRLGFTFKGEGDLVDRDGDGDNDVGGAADSYFGAILAAGYLF